MNWFGATDTTVAKASIESPVEGKANVTTDATDATDAQPKASFFSGLLSSFSKGQTPSEEIDALIKKFATELEALKVKQNKTPADEGRIKILTDAILAAAPTEKAAETTTATIGGKAKKSNKSKAKKSKANKSKKNQKK